MPVGHAFLGPSSSSRWLKCTAAPMTEKLFPDDVKSYMAEGTLAHSFAEYSAAYAVGQITEAEYTDKVEKLKASRAGLEYFTDEMLEAAQDYGRLILAKLTALREECPDAFVKLEQRVDISEWVPESFGTADCIIVSNDTLEVIDFKYGQGKRVSAKANTQMMLYALGALHEYGLLYDPQYLRMTIVQPRLSDRPSSDAISVSELLRWAEEEVKPKAMKAFNGEGEFCPGEETCQFCKAKRQCRARFEKNMEVVDQMRMIVSPDEAAKVLLQSGDISGWLKDLESLVFDTLKAGLPVPGFKLVRGTSRRKIASEEKAVELISKAGLDPERMYERKLKGLTALESEFGKKKFAQLMGDNIVKPEGKPTIAPETDKRPSISEEIMSYFDI